MREKIRLVSSAKTGHFYTTTKNKKTMSENHQKGSPKQAIYGCGTTSDASLKNKRNEGSYNHNGFIVRE